MLPRFRLVSCIGSDSLFIQQIKVTAFLAESQYFKDIYLLTQVNKSYCNIYTYNCIFTI